MPVPDQQDREEPVASDGPFPKDVQRLIAAAAAVSVILIVGIFVFDQPSNRQAVETLTPTPAVAAIAKSIAEHPAEWVEVDNGIFVQEHLWIKHIDVVQGVEHTTSVMLPRKPTSMPTNVKVTFDNVDLNGFDNADPNTPTPNEIAINNAGNRWNACQDNLMLTQQARKEQEALSVFK